MMSSSLTPVELTAAVSKSLEEGGYTRIEASQLGAIEAARGRFYEDAFGVVSVVVYETWAELADTWTEDQARLVELMSAHMTRSDAKSWDGYLVLLCPGSAPIEEAAIVERIRYDITRVRKLIAVGEELASLSDVDRMILPLLPLEPEGEFEPEASTLDLLPDLLTERGISRVDIEALIDAFREQQPLLDALHNTDASR
jgi:hypothetical protein